MKTIEFSIDDELLTRVNHTIAQQKTTLAALVRESLIHYLNRLKIRELEKRHREGYDRHPVQKGEFDI